MATQAQIEAAKSVSDAATDFNRAITAAFKAGLHVSLDTYYFEEFGSADRRPQITATCAVVETL